MEITCPATVQLDESGVEATVTASDGYSGLASDPSGKVPIATSAAGAVMTTRTAVDNVGHTTTKSCTTQVQGSPPELGRCVSSPSITGGFTPATCSKESKTHTGKYEWESGVDEPALHEPRRFERDAGIHQRHEDHLYE